MNNVLHYVYTMSLYEQYRFVTTSSKNILFVLSTLHACVSTVVNSSLYSQIENINILRFYKKKI